MQSPLLVFDHLKKTTALVATGPRLDALVASQREQVSTSGRPRA